MSDAVSALETDLRRLGAAAPAACDAEHPVRFAVGRCEWVASQCPTGRLQIKALSVGLELTAEWLQHSQENRLPDQLDALDRAKALKEQLCHARVLHILSEHVDADVLRAVYEPHLDNPQRLLCLVYHHMSPATLPQHKPLDATSASTAVGTVVPGIVGGGDDAVAKANVHGIVDEIAACYGPSVRLGPLIQHLIKHWLKNGPVPPVRRSQQQQQQQQHARPQQLLPQVNEGDTTEGDTTDGSAAATFLGAHGAVSTSSLESPATAYDLSGATSPGCDASDSGSPSPFDFHKVLSSKPGSRTTRLSYSSSPAHGHDSGGGGSGGIAIADAVFGAEARQGGARASISTNSGGGSNNNLFEPAAEELQEARHAEVVAKIAFVIEAPFGGATWTVQRRAEFLMAYAFRAHPQRGVGGGHKASSSSSPSPAAAAAANKQAGSSSSKSRPSYESAAMALHSLFYVSNDPTTLELAAKALGASLDQVMTFWQQCMYMRVFDQLRLPYNIERLSSMKANPLGFVRGLWRDYRHHSAMLPLIGRIMLDFDVADAMLWTALLQQMRGNGMYRTLTLLLNQLPRTTALLQSSAGVRTVWVCAVERCIQQLDMETAGGAGVRSTTTPGVVQITGLSRHAKQVSLVLGHAVSLTERSVAHLATHASQSKQEVPSALLVSARGVETLARICCRVRDWDRAYRCCAAMASLCTMGSGDESRASMLQCLRSMVANVLGCLRTHGSGSAALESPAHLTEADGSSISSSISSSTPTAEAAAAAAAVVVVPLGQFLRHIPTHRVGPATAILLVTVYEIIRDDDAQHGGYGGGGGGARSDADTFDASLLRHLSTLPRHWAEYQKFVAHNAEQTE